MISKRSRPRPVLGIVYGMIVALVIAVPASVIYLFWGAEAYARYGLQLPQILGLYLVAGIIGGAVVGFAWPLTRWQGGAATVGILAALPLYLGAAFLLSGSLRDPVYLVAGLASAAIVGGITGYRLWSPPDPASRDSRH